MEKTKLNILPVPTFGKLQVNFAEREIEKYETEAKVLLPGGTQAVYEDIRGSGSYKAEVKSGDEALFIQYVNSDSSAIIDTAVNAESSSHIKLVQVFESGSQIVSRIETSLADSAQLELIQLYIGGADTVSEIVTKLDGRKSRFDANIGYTLSDADSLDINLIAEHTGRKSTSAITVNGVLDGNAHKAFKGTIDFKNGSAGAKGAEQENVLMLSESADNRTVPVILCAEEDVEGSHGATIGRIDDKQVFYMQSRGIPEDKLYELVARARLAQVIKAIGDKTTESRIYKALDWGEINE